MDMSIATAAEGAGNANTGTLSSPPTAEAPAGGKPDTVEFEIALQLQDLESEGFEAAVAAAADSAGGALLFDMPMPAETDCRRVAAVSIGSGENRLLMLVTQPSDDEALRVEAVEKSSHPLARIVAAYAGLMDRLAVAA
jgi:hypothetical protein